MHRYTVPWARVVGPCILLLSGSAPRADDAKPADASATVPTPPTSAPAEAPAGAGLGWGVDAFGMGLVATGAPQTTVYQGLGASGGVDARLSPWPWLGLEIEAQYLGVSARSGGQSGGAFIPAGGLRFDPITELPWGTFYLGVHAGYALTGPLGRPAFDATLGVEWRFANLRLGPTVRFVDILSEANSTQIGGDARLVLLGITIGLGPDPTPPPPPIQKETQIVEHTVVQEKVVERVVTVPAPAATVGALKGRVLDLDDKPLQGSVTITPESGGETKTLDASPDYDSRLPPGQYHVEAAAPGYLVRGRLVTLKAGETVLFDFTLRPVPRVQAAVLTATQIEIKQTIQFAFDKAEILKESDFILDEVADILLHHRDLRIRIEGHTDDKGEAQYNLDLSQQRAEAVQAYLVAAGIAADRLEASGYGATRPLVPNTSEAGRAKNRRVQFQIIESKPGDRR